MTEQKIGENCALPSSKFVLNRKNIDEAAEGVNIVDGPKADGNL